MRKLLAEEFDHIEVDSPLALLLHGIAARAQSILGLRGDAFLEWLDAVAPADLSDHAGLAEASNESRLADSLDELDGMLLSALAEMDALDAEGVEGADAEEALAQLWRRTFSAYAAAQEDWLERAFVRRGRAIVEEIYPDRDERSRLYQYGFTPYVGRRFEQVAPEMRAVIEAAQGYGTADPADRFSVFAELGELIAQDRGFGFRVRATETDRRLLRDWQGVLGWWVRAPGAEGPEAANLRAWQRFVADNIDFRMGVAVGAVVARAWSEGVGGALVVPSLETWKATTGLPWFGFWAREMLRWGTLDPFVAFTLAQGRVKTRDEGAARRGEFEEWLRNEHEDIEPDDFIDPQLFLQWERSLRERRARGVENNTVVAELIGVNGEHGPYRVVPVEGEETIDWIDAAGFVLARSNRANAPFRGRLYRQDFLLHTDDLPSVEKTFPE